MNCHNHADDPYHPFSIQNQWFYWSSNLALNTSRPVVVGKIQVMNLNKLQFDPHLSPRSICGIVLSVPFMWSHHATYSSPRSHHDQSSTPYNRVIQCSCCLKYSQIGCTNKICCIHNQALLRHFSLLPTVAGFPLLHTGNLLALVGYMAHSTHLLFNPLAI